MSNVNADFKLLTHNRYSVLNGYFVRQTYPSSLKLGGEAFLRYTDVEMINLLKK